MKTIRFFLIILLFFSICLNIYSQKEDKKFLFGIHVKIPEFGISDQNKHSTYHGKNGSIRPSAAVGLELNGQIILNDKWSAYFGTGIKLRTYNIQSNILLENWKGLAMINRPLPIEEWGFSLSKVNIKSSFLVFPIGLKYNLYEKNFAKKFRPFLSISFQPHFRIASYLNAKYTKPQTGFIFGNNEKRKESSFENEILETYRSQIKDRVYAIAPSFGIAPVHRNLGFEIAFPIYISQFDKDLTTHYFSVQMSVYFNFRNNKLVKEEERTDDKLF